MRSSGATASSRQWHPGVAAKCHVPGMAIEGIGSHNYGDLACRTHRPPAKPPGQRSPPWTNEGGDGRSPPAPSVELLCLPAAPPRRRAARMVCFSRTRRTRGSHTRSSPAGTKGPCRRARRGRATSRRERPSERHGLNDGTARLSLHLFRQVICKLAKRQSRMSRANPWGLTRTLLLPACNMPST